MISKKKKKKSLKPPEVGGHSDGKQVVKHQVKVFSLGMLHEDGVGKNNQNQMVYQKL